jgi:Subtilase family
MPGDHNFEHLPLLLRRQGIARLRGFGTPSPQTVANRNARQGHSDALRTAGQTLSANWQERRAQRRDQDLPVIPEGIPILLQVDPSLELDVLREKFAFEIVVEQEEGFVIVASQDIEIAPFLAMVNGFAVQVHGSATIAQVHRLFDDPDQADRLRRILSDRLLADWPGIRDDQTYIVDIGIACTGTQEIRAFPKRGKRDMDADWARKEREWSQARADAYNAWDNIKVTREAEIEEFARFHEAEILHLIDGAPFDAAVLPDSFTIRLRIVGKGLKDFILNYAYIFEVVEPEDIALPQRQGEAPPPPAGLAAPTAPDVNAPAICVIDSGIQEAHLLIQPAIDQVTSHCFLPGKNTNDVGDFVRPGGHGTRVAGAILYGEVVAKNGTPQLPFWIQNARVLDENNSMPVELFPPQAVRAAVERFHRSPRNTRIFNHSINAYSFCRTRYMSAWAAEIDLLCATYDVLFVQSAGNLPITGTNPQPGVRDHLIAGRNYPDYLSEASARVANPGQSLQALTVGSVAYGSLQAGDWTTFAPETGHPSAFSRSGFGIWSVIKPEIVEYGGDDVRTTNVPPDVQEGGRISAACPELVRSTAFPPGPPFDRDVTGTSFAAPKVARIAAQIQRVLPNEPALLYRALIVQSARWPTWAEALLAQLRAPNPNGNPDQRAQLLDQVAQIVRRIGYGIPDESRATVNTDHRTTFITSGERLIHARECHIYQVPIPPELRGQADEFDIRLEVTLSYVAQPRRTRRNLRRYLSTWVDWKSSKLGEGINDFYVRAMRDEENDAEPLPGSALPWTLNEKSDAGFIRNTKRNSGTVQKDWAVVKSNTLPDHFCIAVIGHAGWSHDPDSTARYALAVTLQILGEEIAIYEPLRTAIIELQTEVGVEVEAEAEIEVEE